MNFRELPHRAVLYRGDVHRGLPERGMTHQKIAIVARPRMVLQLFFAVTKLYVRRCPRLVAFLQTTVSRTTVLVKVFDPQGTTPEKDCDQVSAKPRSE